MGTRLTSFGTALLLLVFTIAANAQTEEELNSGWKCQAIGKIKADGEKLSQTSFSTQGWLNATVPGTVLTTLINNKLVPDPFYGLNNEKIPDIYTTGRDYYTYWFVKDFNETKPGSDGQVWLNFRGVNYSCDIWLNGHRLNQHRHSGMYLRQTYNITPYLSAKGANRLAVIVYPPDPVGNPNGGQGGDGEIARGVGHQYAAGWDWIQPIRDRNTGIWDKVTLQRTGLVRITNPHIITLVPGLRYPDVKDQAPAQLQVSAGLENTSDAAVNGSLHYSIDGETVSIPVNLAAHTTTEVHLPDYTLHHPRLWWPNGYGEQALYHTDLVFEPSGAPASDKAALDFGVRQLTTSWNTITQSRQLEVNGQKIFIKGGNWIVSDELLRFSAERYDAEVRFHHDMNLNLIRVWGGGITERPEFYAACDRYGMLVFQDFWNSGDCNGRWEDPQKKEDQWTRRNYPDDHNLFVVSAADQIRMLRNHPSLAFWCGGNEITPPIDIFNALKDSLLPSLDNTRQFFDYSNSDSMSFNNLGGNGDGPYGIQPLSTFWAKRTYPFNSEVGSVGTGDFESLQRFLPKENQVPPVELDRSEHGKIDPVWDYHKYISYEKSLLPYGPIKDLRDFAEKAQLVNYDQYRALMEGFSSHMWSWYTGSIIWKTQNPWTALRGQMYDYFLDVNACLYGLRNGSAPLHIMYDPITGMTMIANNTFRTHRDLMMEVRTVDMAGNVKLMTKQFFEVGPTIAKNYLPIGKAVDEIRKKEGTFLSLRLVDTHGQLVSDNFYWLPDSSGVYSGLQKIGSTTLAVEAKETAKGQVTVTLRNPAGGPVAFFNRLSLVDPKTKERLLPVFYSDNYVSVLPGESKTVTMEYTPKKDAGAPQLSIRGWNVKETVLPIKR